MIFDPDKLKETPRVTDERYDYKDFPVTADNYSAEAEYGCDWCDCSDISVKPMLLQDTSMYDPRDGRFRIEGVVVYACNRCERPATDQAD